MPTKEVLVKLKDKKLSDIAQILKIDPGELGKLYKAYNIERVELRGRSRRLPIPPKEDLENIKEKTLVEIADIYKTDPTTVSRWFKKYQIERESLQGRHLKVEKDIPSKDELLKLNDLTYRQIAELYEVNHMEVCGWFKAHKISRKPWLSKIKKKYEPTKEIGNSTEKIKLDLISKIMIASDDVIIAIHTLLGVKN